MSLEYLLALLLALPIAWGLGWMMALRYLKLRSIVELNQLKESLKHSHYLIEELTLAVERAKKKAQ